MKTFIWIIVAGLIAGSPSVGHAQASGPGWKHAGSLGMTDLVLVDKARDKDKDLYRAAADSICGPKLKRGFCKVLFWSDERMVPRALPMSDAQVNSMRANWTWNGNTGHRSFLWACDIDPDPAQCFSR